MKKVLTILLLMILTIQTGFTADKYSKEYLQSNKHFAVANPMAEGIVERAIKSSLKKETGAKFKVKFQGYTLSSMKKGIFKYLELTGEDVNVEDMIIPYVHLKSISDYNYVDYTKDPVEFKSNMEFAYDVQLSAETLNSTLKRPEYQNVIKSVNTLAYPLFEVKGVSTKILKSRVYILTEYNFPVKPAKKNKVFVASSDFKVVNGKIRAANVGLDSAYGRISLNQVANLINLLNPLEFTMELLNTKKCNANIENVNVVDNIIKVDGKIFVKGD